METGINNLKDLIEIIVGLIGAVSLASAAYTYSLSKKQLNFAVIVSCTERFQKIMPQLKSLDESEKLKAIKQYIDLCNEELFYFKHGYLPEEIIDEWIDGMVWYLPQFIEMDNDNSTRKLQHFSDCKECLKEIHEHKMLQDYPRIIDAFVVTKYYKVKEKSERIELIKIIKNNINSANESESKLSVI